MKIRMEVIPQPTPTSGDKLPSRPQVVFIVGVMALSAILLARAAYLHLPGVSVPPFVAYVVSAVLLAGAAMAVLRTLGRGEGKEWLILVVLGGFMIAGGWVAFFDRSGSCHSSGPMFLPMPSCRAGFGIGVAINALFAALVIVEWRRRLRVRG